MKRPRHIWATFLLCLLVAIGGMSWLTIKAIELDRAELAARHQQELLTLQADFEGNVRLALRRMDQFLAELFAEESDWPDFAYQSFYPSHDETPVRSETNRPSKDDSLQASPLLNPQTVWNQFYFQIGPDNSITSPNLPPAPLRALADANGWLAPEASQYEQRLRTCQAMVARYDLPKRLRAVRVRAADLPIAAATDRSVEEDSPRPPVAKSDPASQEEAASAGDQALQTEMNPQLAQKNVQASEQIDRGNDAYQRRLQDAVSYQSKSNRRLQKRDALFGNAPPSPPIFRHSDSKPTDRSTASAEPSADMRSRPLWLGSELILARQVELHGVPHVQGCWLDWPAIQDELARRVADLLPTIRLDPVHDPSNGNLSRMLATLPAQLDVTAPALSDIPIDGSLSPMRLSLWIAWMCFVLAAIAFAMLLAGVVALSERRAAFVSAVTHELRTPLTTFRMYADMLSEGMVPDAARRQQYLDTLKTEADRLFHLIENVLAYAQLEKGPARRAEATQTVGELLDAIQTRMETRACRDGMRLVAEIDEPDRGRLVHTDVAAVEQIVTNLVDNACKYADSATDRRIHLSMTQGGSYLSIRVRDHGPGIDQNEVASLFRPFTKSADQAARSAPGVGLGLALCRRLARQLGGQLTLEPTDGNGACFFLRIPISQGLSQTTK